MARPDHTPSLTVSRDRWRLRLGAVIVAAAAGAASLVAATDAPAAPQLTIAPGWTATAESCQGEHSGQSDERSIRYAVCGFQIRRYAPNGAALPPIPLPAGVGWPTDVAPSPDGRHLYIALNSSTPRRLNRMTDTQYTLDAQWRLASFSYGAAMATPVGQWIHADANGELYLSNSSFFAQAARGPTPNVVAKFAATGRFLTSFGEWGKAPGQWITNQDIAVSRDGRRVYVGENCGVACNYEDPAYQGSRVTRYDYAGGRYRFTRIVTAQGPRDGHRFPPCGSAGAAHSAYSVALDGYDNLYVTSTTCGRLQKFDSQDRFVESIATYVDDGVQIEGVRNHFISSDWAGRIMATEWSRRISPVNARSPVLPPVEPLPAPDTVAPVLADTALPASTPTRDITVGLQATDDQGVAEVRLANEDGTWSEWAPFQADVQWRLTAGYGVKGVYVQVRDMAGNESLHRYRTLRYEAVAVAPDAVAPRLDALVVPARTSRRVVTATLRAVDDVAVAHVRFTNEDGRWSAWRNWAPESSWTLTAGYGGKIVYAQVRDAAGNESAVRRAAALYVLGSGDPSDEVRPSNVVTWDSGATRTSVALGWNAAVDMQTGIAAYRVYGRRAGTFTWGRIGTTPSYARRFAWTGRPPGGRYQVHVRAVDGGGNEASPGSMARTVQALR